MTRSDYQRLHHVIASTLSGTNVGTPQASLFFAVTGSFLISQVHKVAARPVAGVAFYRVGDDGDSTLAFGKFDGTNGRVFGDDDAFHCWIECDGIAIDLQTPVFQPSGPSSGRAESAWREVFRRPLTQMSRSPGDLRRQGDFFLLRDPALSIRLMERFMTGQESVELVKLCLHRYRQSQEVGQPVQLRSDVAGARNIQLHPVGL